LNHEGVTFDRDTQRDDVLKVRKPSPRRMPDDPRREIHQPAPLVPRRRDHRQVTTRCENMPRILQEPAQLRPPERRLLRPAHGTADPNRTGRPSELRVRRKRRDQQINPALKSEQCFPKLMRPVRAQPHRRPLIGREIPPQSADEMLRDRKVSSQMRQGVGWSDR